MSIFKDQLFEASTAYPKLSMTSAKLALNLSYSGVPSYDRKDEEKSTMAVQLGSIEVNTFNS